MAKYTNADWDLARELWEMSGPKAPMPHPGRYYMDNMAARIAKFRRSITKKKNAQVG